MFDVERDYEAPLGFVGCDGIQFFFLGGGILHLFALAHIMLHFDLFFILSFFPCLSCALLLVVSCI